MTGGAGYVGSHAAKALYESGITPVVFDNFVYGHRRAVRYGPLVEGDLSDRASIDRAFHSFDCAAVLHFAAYAYVGESVSDPGKYYRNNVGGTLNLLDAMVAANVKKLVFSSTCATYGVPQRVPIDESHTQSPINPYGETKRVVEQMLRAYFNAHGLSSVSLRYFNAAGADASAEIGEDHTPETHLIPLLLDVAAGHLDCVRVNGNDYPTPDGTCIRDYVHVTDLALAHVSALMFLESAPGVHAFNLSTGRGHSVFEIIDAARRVTGHEIPIVIGARRMGDPAELVGDPRLAETSLSWRARHSALDNIMHTAWAWHQRKTTA